MSENTTEKNETASFPAVVAAATEDAGAPPKAGATLVDAIFDIGITWAAHGLKVAHGALAASGKTLDTTAKALERIASELAKKDGATAEKGPDAKVENTAA